MENYDLEQKVELMEYQLGLLFENTEFSRFLYEYKITREENKKIGDLLQSLRDRIYIGERITSGEYESSMKTIANKGYHFYESYLQLCWRENRWEEIFEEVYGDSTKFKNEIERGSRKR